jgi:hypothetical protein
MALPNVITHTITEAEVEDFQRDLEHIHSKNPFLDMPIPTLKKVRAVGPEREPYIERVLAIWKQYPTKVPAELSLGETESDYALYKQAHRIVALYMNHVSKLEHIALASASDAIATIDKAYAYLKTAAASDVAVENALKDVVEMLKVKKPPPPAPTP